MRAIAKPVEPQYQIGSVYTRVVAGINDPLIRAAFTGLAAEVANAAADYDTKALDQELYAIPADSRSKDTVYLAGLTKKQFSNLYSQYFVMKEDPRQIYDNLLALAPFGKCPFCGYCDATELDHYLPKTKFPLLTVVPLNLVPSCSLCNKAKGNRVAITREEQIFHPYFDHYAMMEEQWIFAQVIESTPARISFFVETPASWSPSLSDRAASHFSKNKLRSRFSDQAADELSSLRYSLQMHFDANGSEGVRFQLATQASAEFQRYKNSWKTAMYQALSNSDWYCEGGFASA